jgi:cytochrome c-type biogenesis protein CcmH
MSRLLIILGLIWPLAFPVWATVDTYEFDTPEQEASYKKLINEIRCTVCQNQNIADSNAELAQDFKRKTYEMVMAGKGEDEILDFMASRYGDFVLYSPRVKSQTLLLWGGPFLILALGLFILARVLRQRSKPQTQLSQSEQERAAKLLEGKINHD